MFYLPHCDRLPEQGAMPVIKTTFYPLSEYGTGPLCYLRCAAVKNLGVMLDLMCFEREPRLSGSRDPFFDSSAAVCFDFFPELGLLPLTAAFNSQGDGGIYSPDRILLRALPVSTYGGADEQGWYWGVRFYATEALLRDYYGRAGLTPGQRLLGAAYKFDTGSAQPHFGAIAKVEELSVFSRKNLAEFTVRPY